MSNQKFLISIFVLFLMVFSTNLWTGQLEANERINIVTNGGFEEWTDNLPNNWYGVKSSIPDTAVVEVTESAHSGSSACQLINDSGSHKRFTTQGIPVTLSTEYNITFWVKGEGEIRSGLWSGESYWQYNDYITVSSTEWAEYTQTVTGQADYEAAEFIFSLRNTMGEHLMIDDVVIEEGGVLEPTAYTIYDIQYTEDLSGDSPHIDEYVVTSGVVTSSDLVDGGFVIQNGEGPWNGIVVYSSEAVAEGDLVEVTGTVIEYWGKTEISDVTSLIIQSSGNPLPAPLAVTPAMINDGEAYESVLVQLSMMEVVGINAGNQENEWLVTNYATRMVDTCYVDNGDYTFVPYEGAHLEILTGPLNYSYSNFKVAPRYDADIVVAEEVSSIGWGNLQWPYAMQIVAGETTENIYGRVWMEGVTDSEGQGAGITAEIGYGAVDTDPTTWTNWVAATYNVDDGSNDEYMGNLMVDVVDTFHYTYRYLYESDAAYYYASERGILTVIDQPPPQVNVTFQVDMAYVDEVSPDGVHLAGSFQGWDPATTEMLDDDLDGIYTITLELTGGEYHEYKFINGNAWGQDESIQRNLTVPEEDLILDAVYFNNYMPVFNIVINEIMYNPIEAGTDVTEFVELYNGEMEAVDLSGYSFLEGFEFTFPQGAMIDAGDYVVVAVNAEEFEIYHGFAPDYQWISGALGNGGEDIVLVNPVNGIVDSVDYDDGGAWPNEADGDGYSLELMDPMYDNTLPESWQASFTSGIGGSPGEANILNVFPEFLTLELQATTDMETWEVLGGDLETGFTLPLDEEVDYYYLDVTENTELNIPLAVGFNPFYVTGYPETFFEYWAVRGVDENAGEGTWQAHMWQIINGNAPQFYLKVEDGQVYTVIDGLQRDYAGDAAALLRINGDYLKGDYTYTGTVISDLGLSSEEIVIPMSFIDIPPQIIVDETQVSTSLMPGEMGYETLLVGNAGSEDLIITALYNDMDGASREAASWLTEDISATTIMSGETAEITLNFDATGLELGDYFTTLYIESNDPNASVVMIDVTLYVENMLPPRDLMAQSYMGDYIPLNWIAPDAPEVMELMNDSGMPQGYNNGWGIGNIITTKLTAPAYPITFLALEVALYDFAATGTEDVVFHIYEVGEDGAPGAEIYNTGTVTVTTFYPYFYVLDISDAAVTAGDDIFVGIEYMSGIMASIPSVLTDNSVNIPSDINYYYSPVSLSWIEHYTFWNTPEGVGYSMIRAIAEVPFLGREVVLENSYEPVVPVQSKTEAIAICIELPEELMGMMISNNSNDLLNSRGYMGYNIYRSMEPGMYGDPIAYVTELSYLDEDITLGQEYYYVVTGVYQGGESVPTNEVSAIGGQSGIQLSEVNLSEELDWNATLDVEVILTNTGNIDLNWQIFDYDDLQWLTYLPGSGVLAPGTSEAITFSFYPMEVKNGTFTKTIIFADIFGATDLSILPVTLTVTGGIPTLELDVTELVQETEVGATPTQTFTITNNGGEDLNFTIINDFGYDDEEARDSRNLLLTEDFESGVFPPANWSEYQLGDAAGWTTSTANYNSATTSAFHDDDDVTTGCDDWLVSPQITIPEDLVDAQLSFWEMNNYVPSYYEHHGVWISTGSGDPADGQFVLLDEYTETTTVMTERMIPLADYIGQDIYIGFKYTGDYASEWWIDDVVINGFEAVEWLSESPSMGIADPLSDPVEVVVTFNATQLIPGDYAADIIISDATFGIIDTIPVALTVNPVNPPMNLAIDPEYEYLDGFVPLVWDAPDGFSRSSKSLSSKTISTWQPLSEPLTYEELLERCNENTGNSSRAFMYYNLYRRTESGLYTEYAPMLSDQSYMDTAVAFGDVFYYAVTAFYSDGAGESDISNELMATVGQPNIWVDSPVVDVIMGFDDTYELTVYNNGGATLEITDVVTNEAVDTWLLSATPDMFTIAPEESAILTLNYSTAGLQDGQIYSTPLEFICNDLLDPTFTSEFSINVVAPVFEPTLTAMGGLNPEVPEVPLDWGAPGGPVTVTIGDGTEVGKYLPVEPLYGYSYSQVIYYQDEIGQDGAITEIKYNYTAYDNFEDTNDIVVYMGHTTKTQFDSNTDWIPVTELTEVFNGTWEITAGIGWVTITLDTPFNYNNMDNLVIAVDENRPSWDSGSDDFYCTLVDAPRGIEFHSDGTNPDPASPPVAYSGSPKNYIANIEMTIVPPIDITIGDGTEVGKYLPIEPLYGYSYSQVIYYQDEIGMAGDINSISYNYTAYDNFEDTNDIVVYMGHTTKTQFDSNTDWIPVTELTEVFNGTWEITAGVGWVTIDFETPFAYNGMDNLVIAVDENRPSWDSGSDDFYCTLVDAPRGIEYHSDGTNPDPASPPTAYYGSPKNYIANVMMNILPDPEVLARNNVSESKVVSRSKAVSKTLISAGREQSPVNINVWRSPVSGGPYELIETIGANETTYSDYAVDYRETYYYVLTDVYSNTYGDYQSQYSNEVMATPDRKELDVVYNDVYPAMNQLDMYIVPRFIDDDGEEDDLMMPTITQKVRLANNAITEGYDINVIFESDVPWVEDIAPMDVTIGSTLQFGVTIDLYTLFAGGWPEDEYTELGTITLTFDDDIAVLNQGEVEYETLTMTQDIPVVLHIAPFNYLAEFTGDTEIDGSDLVVFLHAMGGWHDPDTGEQSSNWNPACDLAYYDSIFDEAVQGNDNFVNYYDLVEFAPYFATHWPPANPLAPSISKKIDEAAMAKSTASKQSSKKRNIGTFVLDTETALIERGDEFTVKLLAEDVIDLYGAQFELDFDTDAMEVVSVENGDFTQNDFFTYDVEDGTLKVIATKLGAVKAATGNGVVAEITLKAKSAGSTDLALSKVAANDGSLRPVIATLKGDKADVKEKHEVSAPKPIDYSLGQNYPNPFNPVTGIHYELPEDSDVHVGVYNVSGQLVKTLVNERQEAGYYEVKWDGTDQENGDVASGVYIYRMTTDKFSDVKRMTLLK